MTLSSFAMTKNSLQMLNYISIRKSSLQQELSYLSGTLNPCISNDFRISMNGTNTAEAYAPDRPHTSDTSGTASL